MTDQWTGKDVLMGLLFLVTGAVITAYSYLAMSNDVDVSLWALGWVVGPMLILLGINGIVRSLRAGRLPEISAEDLAENDEVLRRMAGRGVDFSERRSLDFFVLVRDEAAAERVHQALEAEGFDARVSYNEGEPLEDGSPDDDPEFAPSWTVTVVVEMVPTLEAVTVTEKRIEAIVQPLGGEMDGWGTMR